MEKIMGLLGAIGAGLAEVGNVGQKIGLEQMRAAIEAERDTRLNEMRNQADLTTRERNKADAAEERTRVATEAGKIAEKRGGLLSANAGLDDANYRGDEGVGVNVQKGQQTPGSRDFLMAKGDYASVASLEEKDVDNARADKRQASDEAHRGQEMKLREAELKIRAAAEGRLAKGTNLDNEIKQITVDNAKRLNALRDEFKTATPERQAKIYEEIQLLTGKDNDAYMPVPLKDDLGNVTGYKIFDKKRGVFVDDAKKDSGPTIRYDKDGKAWTKDANGKVIPYVEPKSK